MDIGFVTSKAPKSYRSKHRHRRNVTSHHFTSLLFTSFHFYVYSNFFGSYQLKGKYNTNIQLIISLQFSSLPLSIERQTCRQDLLSLYSKSLLCISFPEKYISHKSDEQYFLAQCLCISSKLMPFALIGYLATRWRNLY